MLGPRYNSQHLALLPSQEKTRGWYDYLFFKTRKGFKVLKSVVLVFGSQFGRILQDCCSRVFFSPLKSWHI